MDPKETLLQDIRQVADGSNQIREANDLDGGWLTDWAPTTLQEGLPNMARGLGSAGQ